jgi:hypothetical protein
VSLCAERATEHTLGLGSDETGADAPQHGEQLLDGGKARGGDDLAQEEDGLDGGVMGAGDLPTQVRLTQRICTRRTYVAAWPQATRRCAASPCP